MNNTDAIQKNTIKMDVDFTYTNPLLSPEEVKTIILQRVEKIPKNFKFIIILGLNRSGTTALHLHLSAIHAIKFSEFQPVKDIYRNGSVNQSTALIYPKIAGISNDNYILIKETLGGLTPFELNFDLIGTFLAAGVCPRNISVIYVVRNPVQTLNSWRKGLNEYVPVSSFLKASRSLLGFYQKYKPVIGKSVPFVHNSFLEEHGKIMLSKTLHEMGIYEALNPTFDLQLFSRIEETRKKHKMRWNQGIEKTYWKNIIAPVIERGTFSYKQRFVDKLPWLSNPEIEEINTKCSPLVFHWEKEARLYFDKLNF